MLREILANTLIAPETVARLLGINTDIFLEWVAHQRPIPKSVLEMLSGVIGVDLAPYLERKVPVHEVADITPAIWYRFRQDALTTEDREFVFLVRRLGSHINELEEVTGARAVGWKTLFQEIRQNVDTQAPPRVQGVEAANMFRESRSLSSGAGGIGEVLRGNLRTMGVLVVEGSLPKSSLEGCCFYVGNRPQERPCVFANSYQTTWFRRNFILLHEVAHAIFEAESAGAALDFYEGNADKLAEERADAFAQQMLVPRTVLHHLTQKSGLKWDAMSPAGLATLVAETHTEKRTILRAALEGGLISPALFEQYSSFDIGAILPSISYHALSTDEYIRVCGVNADDWKGKRNTTIPSRTLRLPPAYIKGVIEALKNGSISRGKAAAMLMIDERDFDERFGGQSEEDDIDDMQTPLALA
jgi:Zn-dependent peptidase ImmA (M78 family)